jgi:hypothetical protein
MANAPPQVKKWGPKDKHLLTKLVTKGKVDLSRTNNLEYIDQVVWFKHICKRNYRNFCCNFCNYAREQDLEDTLSGAYRKEQGRRNAIFLLQYC